jgi:enoyl-CoA hydratase/carnithine racemase
MTQDAPALLQSRHDGGILVLTFNAPKRRNALSTDMRVLLRQALQEAAADAQVRAIVLTGAGGVFCAGGDLTEMGPPDAAPNPVTVRERLGILHDCMRVIIAGPKPTVAAVEGSAYGAGLSLAAACDSLVAGRGARFSAVFGRVGLGPDCALAWTLPQRIGVAAARDMILTTQERDAAWALGAGLADQVVEDGQALDAALAQARSYARCGPLAAAAVKRMMAGSMNSREDALTTETDMQFALMASDDHREARNAFLEKRQVAFRGR